MGERDRCPPVVKMKGDNRITAQKGKMNNVNGKRTLRRLRLVEQIEGKRLTTPKNNTKTMQRGTYE
jgi:hypothetical protein